MLCHMQQAMPTHRSKATAHIARITHVGAKQFFLECVAGQQSPGKLMPRTNVQHVHSSLQTVSNPAPKPKSNRQPVKEAIVPSQAAPAELEAGPSERG